MTSNEISLAVATAVSEALKAMTPAITEALDAHKANSAACDDTYAALIGQLVFIRTVTMTNCGRLVAVLPQAFVLEDAVWVANTGRWSNFCKTGNADEVEPFADGPVYVGKAGLIDMAKLPKIPSAK